VASDPCPEEATSREVVLGGVTYVCPRPDHWCIELGTLIHQAAVDLSPEELSYILAWVRARGSKESLLSVERFIVERI
jgi:hypothetical protein